MNEKYGTMTIESKNSIELGIEKKSIKYHLNIKSPS